MSTDAPSLEPRPPEPTTWLRARGNEINDWISDWGRVVIDSVTAVGDFSQFVWQTLVWLATRMPRRETIWPNFYQVGVLSLPVVALTGTFIGMVLAVQSYFQFRQLGLETRLGGVINMTLVRELGPVLAATMLAGRVGSAMAAELGTMRVTEQIDALSAMGANPIRYLVVPRLLACFFMIPTLTVMADFMGVAGGHFYSVYVLGIDIHHYWSNSAAFVGTFDVITGLVKSIFFGTAIAMVSCYQGFHCDPGAEGVGRASTASFVYSFVLILILDLLLGILLDSVYFTLFPEGAKLV
jgi:phospholipid/cholesterol/gamma-HCH transport system permease protein